MAYSNLSAACVGAVYVQQSGQTTDYANRAAQSQANACGYPVTVQYTNGTSRVIAPTNIATYNSGSGTSNAPSSMSYVGAGAPLVTAPVSAPAPAPAPAPASPSPTSAGTPSNAGTTKNASPVDPQYAYTELGPEGAATTGSIVGGESVATNEPGSKSGSLVWLAVIAALAVLGSR